MTGGEGIVKINQWLVYIHEVVHTKKALLAWWAGIRATP